LWIVVATGKMSLRDFYRDHLLEGTDDLVIGGGICKGLKGLGLSHLYLNLLVEELDSIFPLEGFSLVECLHLVSLILVVFIHLIWYFIDEI